MVAKNDPVLRTIAIVGFPRSGTTWFANILNSHPLTVYRHEVFGRLYGAFGEEIFSKLRFDHGLSDGDYAAALRTVLKSHVASEKPPFFSKAYRRFLGPKTQKIVWSAARMIGRFSPLYARLFTPPPSESLILVIKETRSSANLASILHGIRTNQVIALARHPYGVIGSHLKGYAARLMDRIETAKRLEWYRAHSGARYVVERAFDESYIREASEVELLAIMWRVQNENYLEMAKTFPLFELIGYERFLSDVVHHTKSLFEKLGISWHEQVLRFIQSASDSESRALQIFPDASATYYSVYRERGFKPNQWNGLLSSQEIELIDSHTAAFASELGLVAR